MSVSPRLTSGLALLLGALLATLTGCSGDPAPTWNPGATDAGPATPSSSAASPSAARSTTAVAVSMSATGDIIMGNAPARLPARGGDGFFDAVQGALRADLVMGNLEAPLTADTGAGKCGADSTRCYQFRVPPSYAGHLRDAGFHVLNQANNHGYDYGPAGYRNTQQALEEHGLKHTGAPDEITVVEVQGVKIAVVGFASYPWSNSLTDIAAAKRVVAAADKQADLVVVQAHMGAEGADKTRVKPGSELFLGENRGDPVRFSHAMIDAGADLVVGHGPHVLRGLEFYRGRLIAYSLGNFAGGAGTLNKTGRLGWGGVLKVSLNSKGDWAGGKFIPTYMNAAGLPVPDPDKRGLGLVKQLSADDFPDSGATFAADGSLSPPDAG